jgi:hypothetical protein
MEVLLEEPLRTIPEEASIGGDLSSVNATDDIPRHRAEAPGGNLLTKGLGCLIVCHDCLLLVYEWLATSGPLQVDDCQ